MTAQVAGHFGEWMQGRIGPEGPVALITLPCPALSVRAHCRPAARFSLAQPDGAVLSVDTARRFLAKLDLPQTGAFTLRCDMMPGGGAGASTASLLALAAAAGPPRAALDLARACHAVEGASDPLMFDAPDQLLWASREGRVMAQMPPVPRFDVVGGFFGPGQRTNANDDDFADISDLVAAWPRAAQTGDRATLAALASAAARRTQALRGPRNDPTEALARDTGALGFLRAHTGPARGLLFAPGNAPSAAPDLLREAGFDRVLSFAIGGAA